MKAAQPTEGVGGHHLYLSLILFVEKPSFSFIGKEKSLVYPGSQIKM